MRFSLYRPLKIFLAAFVSLSLVFCLSGCASIFIPKKQRVTIHTGDPEAKVFMDGGTELGSGAVVKERIEKDGIRQVTVVTPGSKPDYYVIMPSHRPVFFWLAQPFNVLTCFYGYAFDFYYDKNISYRRVHHFDRNNTQLTYRNPETEKYIEYQAVWLNPENPDRDFISAEVKISKKPEVLKKRMEAAEAKAKLKANVKTTPNRNVTKVISGGPYTLAKDQAKNTEGVRKLLGETGYADTSSSIFPDPVNTLRLQALVMEGCHFSVNAKRGDAYRKLKLLTRWYFVNHFGEIRDSIEVESFSGDLYLGGSSIFQDAMANSFLLLQDTDLFKKYLKKETHQPISDPLLLLSSAKDTLGQKELAQKASLIVQTADGHGSGFAVTNDGYVVTNYHVISSRYEGKYDPIYVIDSDGLKFEAQVVRVNRNADLALLKVDRKFAYCVRLSSEKTFTSTQPIFTIGAPKSVELGQSVTNGVVSGERQAPQMTYVQLSLAVSPGNSGGPVFDDQCRLQGVLVSKLISMDVEGICFAIPGYKVMEYLNLSY